MAATSPYFPPFNRRAFAKRAGIDLDVHPRERGAAESYFQNKNEHGYQHDLGAQDAWLDDLGVLCNAQVHDPELLAHLVTQHLDRWEAVADSVVHASPWWGRHLNARSRRAATGEPRPLLRLLHQSGLQQPMDQGCDLRTEDCGDSTYSDWGERALPLLFGNRVEDWKKFELGEDLGLDRHGVLLPSDATSIVGLPVILDPCECTPDLPPRILGPWPRLVPRDQGPFPTCVAHALVTALDLLARRERSERITFSPLWLHVMSGRETMKGRSLGEAVDVLERDLPCQESALPYDEISSADRAWLEGQEIRSDSRANGERLGRIRIACLACSEIAKMKTLIAAGWVVVVTTRVTESFLHQGFAANHGLFLSPMAGERFEGAHAWCLVGYEHVDGSTAWKYQGRFIALNSWGPRFAPRSAYGRGTCSFPFSHVANHGLEAFAIRLEPRR